MSNETGEWIDMQEGCHNCGKPLEARPSTAGGFVIHGYEPMEWRHTDGTIQCVIIRKPRPYTEANQYKEYCQLRQERDNANERAWERSQEEPTFRGGEYAASVAESQAEIQRTLK